MSFDLIKTTGIGELQLENRKLSSLFFKNYLKLSSEVLVSINEKNFKHKEKFENKN